MTLEEAYGYSSPSQCLGRSAWIKSNIILHLVSCAQTLEQIKMELDNSSESLNADDWNIFEIRE